MTDSFYRLCDECHVKIPLIRGGAGRVICINCSNGAEDNCIDCLKPAGGVQYGEGFVRCSRCHSYYCEMRCGLPHEVEIRALRLNMLSLYQTLLRGRSASGQDMYDPLIRSLLAMLDELTFLLDPNQEPINPVHTSPENPLDQLRGTEKKA